MITGYRLHWNDLGMAFLRVKTAFWGDLFEPSGPPNAHNHLRGFGGDHSSSLVALVGGRMSRQHEGKLSQGKHKSTV